MAGSEDRADAADRSLKWLIGVVSGAFIGSALGILRDGRETVFLAVAGALTLVLLAARWLRTLPDDAPLVRYVFIGCLTLSVALLVATALLPSPAASVTLIVAGLALIPALLVADESVGVARAVGGIALVAAGISWIQVFIVQGGGFQGFDDLGWVGLLVGVGLATICYGVAVLANATWLAGIAWLTGAAAMLLTAVSWLATDVTTSVTVALFMGLSLAMAGFGAALLTNRPRAGGFAWVLGGAAFSTLALVAIFADGSEPFLISLLALGALMATYGVGTLIQRTWLTGAAMLVAGTLLFGFGVSGLAAGVWMLGAAMLAGGIALAGFGGITALDRTRAGRLRAWSEHMIGRAPSKD